MPSPFTTRPHLPQPWEDDVETSHNNQYLHTIYAVAIAILVTATIVLARYWGPAVLVFIPSHWPWFVFVPFGLVVWFGIVDIVVDYEPAIAVAIATVTGLLIVDLDGLFDVRGILTTQLVGVFVWLWLLATAIGLVIGAAARNVERDNWEDVLLVGTIALVGVIAAVLLWAAIGRWVGASELVAVTEWLRPNWMPAAFGASAALLVLRLRSSARIRYNYDDFDQDEYDDPRPAYDHESMRDAIALDARGEVRGRWIRRILYLIRRSGISFLDASLMLVTAVLFAVTVLYYVPDHLIASRDLSAAQAATARTDERRTVLAMLAAVGAGITLVYTHLRHQLDREANATARFSEGVRQLATDTMSTRLGGLYSLGQIARESPRDADNIVEVLSAYARESTLARGERPEDAPLTPVTTAALRVLSEMPPSAPPPDLRRINLSHAALEDTRFRPSTNFQDADFRELVVTRGIFERVTFRRARLQGSKWHDARLGGTEFLNTDLTSAELTNVRLNDAVFRQSTCIQAQIERTYLRNAMFVDCDLRGVAFSDTDLAAVTFANVDLSGADLSRCDLSSTYFEFVTYDNNTQLPQGFDRSRLQHRPEYC